MALQRSELAPPPGDWRIWALITGRGWGKNRTQAEWLHDQADAHPTLAGFLAGRTLGDVGKTLIAHPRSGIMVTQRAANPCEYKPQQRKVVWSNGAYCDIHTSEEPDGARGPEYAYGLADEIGTWKRVVDFQGNTTWTNLQFGLRAGRHPRMVAASTPRPIEAIQDLIDRSKRGTSVVLTHGTMYENAANLPPSFLEFIEERYAGTRLYRQEVEGELLLDLEDAILSLAQLDETRVESAPELARVVVGIDPALKQKKKSDKTGINVSGRGIDGGLYSLANLSGKMSPDGWGRRAVEAYHQFDAQLMVAEDNVMGDAITSVIRGIDATVNVKQRTASRSKTKRAEPILAFYERGEAHIVGAQKELEDQLVQFTPMGYSGEGSPDDADAHVWAASELMLGAQSSWDDVIAANA